VKERIEDQVADYIKSRGFHSTTNRTEARRLLNVAPAKKKPWVKKTISEALAEKLIFKSHTLTIRRDLKKGFFEPYQVYTLALLQPAMKAELAQFLTLYWFSTYDASESARKAITVAIKAHPKALGWNNNEATNLLYLTLMEYEEWTEDKGVESLKAILNRFNNLSKCNDKPFITVKQYSKSFELHKHLKSNEDSELIGLFRKNLEYYL
jgi:hypothetical protein